MVEQTKGGVIIAFKTALKMGSGLGSQYEDQTIVDQHYSIHPSLNSKAGTNLLHHTCTVENGDKFSDFHFTEAIKQHGTFAPMCWVRCPNLREKRYIPENHSEKPLKLGRYNPCVATLSYSIYVGAAGQDFPEGGFNDMNVAFMDFQLFRVVVLWSFATLFSDPTGSKAHLFTLHPKTAPEPERTRSLDTMKGYSPAECVGLFRETRDLLFFTHLEFLSSMDGMESVAIALSAGHSKIDRLGETSP
jgi:hypothetical protein